MNITQKMISRARTLRKNLTDAERLLWYSLRCRQINGLKFRKQVPLGCYIADFLCYEIRWVIELDGGQHQEQSAYDAERTQWLQQQGYQVQRFWNHDVLSNLSGVLKIIHEVCCSPPILTFPRKAEESTHIYRFIH